VLFDKNCHSFLARLKSKKCDQVGIHKLRRDGVAD
jgi:hypothetical protein